MMLMRRGETLYSSVSPSSEPCNRCADRRTIASRYTQGNPKRDSLQVRIAMAAHPALRPRFTYEWTGDAPIWCRRYRPRATARRRRHAVSAPRPSHARQVGLTPCPGWISWHSLGNARPSSNSARSRSSGSRASLCRALLAWAAACRTWPRPEAPRASSVPIIRVAWARCRARRQCPDPPAPRDSAARPASISRLSKVSALRVTVHSTRRPRFNFPPQIELLYNSWNPSRFFYRKLLINFFFA